MEGLSLKIRSMLSKNFQGFLGREVPLFFNLSFSVLYFARSFFNLFVMAATVLHIPE